MRKLKNNAGNHCLLVIVMVCNMLRKDNTSVMWVNTEKDRWKGATSHIRRPFIIKVSNLDVRGINLTVHHIYVYFLQSVFLPPA